MEPTPTLEEAYLHHRGRVFRICLQILKNQDDAEDATQDLFLHLGRKLASFRGDCKFSTWIHRVTVNFVLMRIRGKQKSWHRGLQSLETMAERAEDSDAGPGSVERALSFVDTSLSSCVERVTVRAAMAKLPVGQRLALELYLQGFEHEEVAELLGASVGASKAQVNRAKHSLASEMGVKFCETESVSDGGLDDLLMDFEQYA